MPNILAICNHATPPATLLIDQFDRVLPINQYAPDRNARLEVWNISHWLLRRLNPVAHDLLDIAMFVYYADNSVRRGTSRDVFSEDWVRRFTFVVPVRELDTWQRESVGVALTETLEYLTEDRFEFAFTQRQPIREQLAIRAIGEALPACPEADCVALYSGGMDSLAGAVHLCASGRKPLLVSHQSRPVLVRRQRNLALSLRQRLTSWEFPHLGVRINRMGNQAVESSQRSRSFLFLSLGSLVAHELGLNELTVPENGITTFNLPRTGQVAGTLATRSTHPRFMQLFRRLVSEVFQLDFKIEAPFIWRTRAEVLEILKDSDCAELLPLSASCAQSRRPRLYPHCGTCSQCIDRRFAVAYTGRDALEDEVNGYEKDVFTDELGDGEEKMQAFSIVQFALAVRQRDDVDSFCEKYVEAYDAIGSVPGDAEQTLQAIYQLHRRFADEVHQVLSIEHGRNWERLYSHELPDTCLLMLTAPTAPRRPDPMIVQRAEELIHKLRECPVGESKPLEDLCEEVLTFLFCEDLPPERALKKPAPQSKTDEGYQRRDLLFENRATEGFWADARRDYDAAGVIADAKNHKDEIDGDPVHGFSSKYLKDYGVGRLGIIVAREVPSDTRTVTSLEDRVSGAVKAQKDQWRDNRNMIILLGENDLVEMLGMKARGQDPADLLRARMFTLKSRM